MPEPTEHRRRSVLEAGQVHQVEQAHPLVAEMVRRPSATASRPLTIRCSIEPLLAGQVQKVSPDSSSGYQDRVALFAQVSGLAQYCRPSARWQRQQQPSSPLRSPFSSPLPSALVSCLRHLASPSAFDRDPPACQPSTLLSSCHWSGCPYPRLVRQR